VRPFTRRGRRTALFRTRRGRLFHIVFANTCGTPLLGFLSVEAPHCTHRRCLFVVVPKQSLDGSGSVLKFWGLDAGWKAHRLSSHIRLMPTIDPALNAELVRLYHELARATMDVTGRDDEVGREVMESRQDHHLESLAKPVAAIACS